MTDKDDFTFVKWQRGYLEAHQLHRNRYWKSGQRWAGYVMRRLNSTLP